MVRIVLHGRRLQRIYFIFFRGMIRIFSLSCPGMLFPLYAYSAGTTVNYVGIPVNSAAVDPVLLVTSDGQRTGVTTFPSKRGTSDFNFIIKDCNVDNWSGLWNKQTYTYLSIPEKFSSSIGDIALKVTYNNATYQWYEDGYSVAYWQTSQASNQTLNNACYATGATSVMDVYWGGKNRSNSAKFTMGW